MQNAEELKEDVIRRELMNEYRIQEFDYTEPTSRYKPILTLAAEKGSGKTTTALLLPPSVLAFSFDGAPDNKGNKTKIIKDGLVRRFPAMQYDKRIKVIDCLRYLRSDPPTPKEYMLTYFYMKAVGLKFKNQYGWVGVDGVDGYKEFLARKAEYLKGVLPQTGNLTWEGWAERTNTLYSLQKMMLNTANIGVFYTSDYTSITYTENGAQITRRIPKWFGTIKQLSDFLIEIASTPDFEKNVLKVEAKVWTSKDDRLFVMSNVVDLSGYKPLFEKPVIDAYFGYKQSKLPSVTRPEPAPSQAVKNVVNKVAKDVANDEDRILDGY